MRFSICLPSYKSHFLSETITSVLNQTYRDFELIILNDCSPNPIRQIVDTFADTRIKYVENISNVGAEHLVLNWNKCLEMSIGQYVMVLGDDDVLDVEYLQTFNDLIENYPSVKVYHCRSFIINEVSTQLMLTPSWPEFESVYDNIWHRLNNKRLQYISDFMYERANLLSLGGFVYFPLAWGSDDVSAYNASISDGIAHSNKPVFSYRASRYTISSTGSGELKMKAVQMQKAWLQNFFKIIPHSHQDKVILEDLNSNLRRIFIKKKVRVVEVSLESSFFKSLIVWIRHNKKYDLSYQEIAFGVLVNLKNRLLK